MSNILMYPINSEKAIRLAESQNKIIFVVNRKANKKQIKEEFEKEFGVIVSKVNTLINKKGEKVAYITIKENQAMDIASKLGMI